MASCAVVDALLGRRVSAEDLHGLAGDDDGVSLEQISNLLRAHGYPATAVLSNPELLRGTDAVWILHLSRPIQSVPSIPKGHFVVCVVQRGEDLRFLDATLSIPDQRLLTAETVFQAWTGNGVVVPARASSSMATISAMIACVVFAWFVGMTLGHHRCAFTLKSRS